MSRSRTFFMSLLAVACIAFVSAAGRTRGGADIHISFAGLICHVFDEGHAPRSVAMRGNDDMPHRATLYLSQSAITSSDVALACDGVQCALDLTNVALRFPGSGLAWVDRDGSYETIVPHLRAVTNGQMRELRADVFDDVPLPASPISAYFELPSGRMSAVAYDVTARYEPDFEHRGERQFAREVALDGHIARPQLLVRRAGDLAWHHIDFEDGGLIQLRMVNEAVPGDHAPTMHATLYYDLAATPIAIRPRIVREAATKEPQELRGRITVDETDPNCANSHFP